jgi:peptidyl-prolyl cis-trans isomerase SurA
MTEFPLSWRRLALLAVLCLAAGAAAAQARGGPRNGDYIVAIINQELVTAGEVDQRIERARQNAARSGAAGRLPPADELRRLVLESLIDERVIVTHARESGIRIDDPEVDRAVQSVAAQNQISVDQLRERLRAEGTDYARFRANLRDQMIIERVREREVYQRIRIKDEDVEKLINEQRKASGGEAELNLAQILITVPEGADEATVAARRAIAEGALARVRAGEPFQAVSRELSADGNREKGGEIGLRPASRLPDVFVGAVGNLAAGEVTSTLLRRLPCAEGAGAARRRGPACHADALPPHPAAHVASTVG